MNGLLTSVFQSPVGPLQISAGENFITEIQFIDTQASGIPGSDESGIINTCREQLNEYFKGSISTFDLPLQPKGSDFEKQVWAELQKIPYGVTISYEELALRLGDIKKIRAAAHANGNNPIPIIIPCHRVIGKDGSLTGYAGGLDRKEWLLSHEGAIAKQYSIF